MFIESVKQMDYLDPNKKKLNSTRLMIGYALLGIAISITTVIVVYLANGYYIDSDTGTVIQNGLIYIDSKPESAEVFLNGNKQRGSTDVRLVVPEGLYNIELKRDGYRQWSRQLQLEGGALRRLTYARMIPTVLDSEVALNLPSLPTMSSQSIDKRWLVLAFTDDPLLMRFIDLEASNLQLENLPLPLGLLNTKEAGVWRVLDWADDNRTFLAEYKTAKTTEFVLIDRANAVNSKNLGSIFGEGTFSSVSLRNRKKDLLFVHNKATGALFRGNATTASLEPYLNNVIEYTSFGNDSVLYVTGSNVDDSHVKAVLKNGDEEYVLRDINKDDTYLLEMSKLGNSLVMGIGSAAENRVIVYNDPINALKKNDFSEIPVPTTVLRVESPQELTISADSSVILARSGNSFASHEFEADRSYKFESETVLDNPQELRWLDGQHFTVSIDGGMQVIMDFNGSNQFELVKSTTLLGGYFDRNVDLQYTFTPEAVDATPARITRTFLRTPADR
jgi:hypothetical protein